MDRPISAQEAKELCMYERLLPTFRRIHSACIHCEYTLRDERLYERDAQILRELGYNVTLMQERQSGVNEYIVSWL